MVELYRELRAPVCHAVLFRWHESLMNGRRDLADSSNYRTGSDPMQVGSGPLHRPTAQAHCTGPLHNPKVHFEASLSSLMTAEMKRFMQWFAAAKKGLLFKLPHSPVYAS